MRSARLNVILAGASLILVSLSGALPAQGYAPEIAARKMKLADGLDVALFASEPQIRQPILVKCDDRGRLWTIQYLQYPNPAGLKRVKVDRWSRTVYDRVPKPPPHGPKGADRITILEDTDGDGRADSFRDFVSGLNLCTGLAFGHGGVFVLQVPYLLFYPDRNRDDVPDSDPEVLLTGFGMEDAQSLANHLTWGPDGWLYGVNGSTTTCRIRGIEFQQGCWRYHPVTKKFELFCEGGGNTYGLTFDENGNLFYSTNGGPFVHAVQGGYFYKSFGKHGPLHNLHTYGHFSPLQRDAVPGGPPTGGTIYLGDGLPDRFRGRFIAGNFLGHTMSSWDVTATGTTVKAKLAETILNSNDTWFGPTDVCTGPDGSLFVCDFHDQRTSHPDPDARWDRSNGRIYRITSSADRAGRIDDLRERSSDELVALLRHRNRWFADRARVLLAERRDTAIAPRLIKLAMQTDDNRLALQGLWTLHASGGLTGEVASELLKHPYEYVRSWTVRLLGDRRKVTDPIANQLKELANSESSAIVLSQLAASAKRLPARTGLPIVTAMMSRMPEINDVRTRALLWWAVESWSVSDIDIVVKTFADGRWWKNRNQEIVVNLVRRFSAEGTSDAYDACLALLKSAPAESLKKAHTALDSGLSMRVNDLHGIGLGDLYTQFAATDDPGNTPGRRKFEPLNAPLLGHITERWMKNRSDASSILLALRADVDGAYQDVLKRLADKNTDAGVIESQLAVLREFGREDCVPLVLQRLEPGNVDYNKAAAISVLSRFDSAEITAKLIAVYSSLSPELQSRCRDVLLSRPISAHAFLKLVEAGQVDPKKVPVRQLRRIALHENKELDKLVGRFWGRVGPGTPEQKLALMRKFNNDLRPGAGDPGRGKLLFTKHCATCHQLFGEGKKIGPDLTNANRKDRAAMLATIVDPGAVVRKEYLSFVAITNSGRVVTGLIAEQDAASVTLLDAKGGRTKLARSEIESLTESATSLMPERLLEQLTPQQVRDLFSYLQK